MVLSEVTTMIQSGVRKNRAAIDQEGVDADPAGGEPAWRAALRLDGGHARRPCGRA